MKDGIYIKCLNFIKNSDNDIYIVGTAFKTIDSFYYKPINSSSLHIVMVESSLDNLNLYEYKNIFAKACKIPYKNKYVMLPLMHTYGS